jgi:coproporphyrinogen III oxidase
VDRAVRVREYLMDLQDRICGALQAEETRGSFAEVKIPGPQDTLSRPRVLEGGEVIERAGVNFTHSRGPALPPAASERRPEAAGRPFQALALSLIVHPRNPHAPTSHMNVRCFLVEGAGEPLWWFGGGFDLTPFYPVPEDVLHWHRTARAACDPFGVHLYPQLKRACDQYFFLAHRGETRGVGGLFFDDFEEGGFDSAFGLMRSVGDHYPKAYVPILQRRKATPYGERERDFQLMRRGRYVEFNLIQDRGTRYGLQSGRRTESLLVSMPPLVAWRYDWQPDPGTREADLYENYLRPRDWLAELEP